MKDNMITIEECQENAQRIWVVFTDQADLPWLKFLKKGYRHCFVLVHDGKSWISIDPMAHYMDVIVHHVDGEFDFPAWLAERGHTVVRALFESDAPRPCPFMPFSCVEVCKRVLGIRSRTIITPHALYKYVTGQRRAFDMRRAVTRIVQNFKHFIRKGTRLWEA